MGSKDQKIINIKSVFVVLVTIFVVIAIICVNFWYDKKRAIAPDREITNFEECVKAGNQIIESNPAKCQDFNGKIYIKEVEKDPIFELAKLFGEKYIISDSEVHINLIIYGENHFRGEYSFGVNGKKEGENFFAMRSGDEYEIIFDGSSGFTCQSLNSFGFPEDMQDGCREEWTGTGEIKGNVEIGPICPVEREDVPCPVPYETYTSRALVIYRADNKKEIFSSLIKPDGTYKFILTGGNYILDIKDHGSDSSFDLPYEFLLVVGQGLEHDISIDTGIR